MNWIIIALINTLFAVLLTLQYKTIHDNKISTLNAYSTSSIMTFIIILVFVIVTKQDLTLNFLDINLITVGVTNFFGSICNIEAYKEGKLSILGPIENSRPFFVAIFALLFISSELTIPIIIGTILIILGAFLLSKNGNNVINIKSVMLVVLSVLLFALNTVFAKKAMLTTSIWTVSLESLLITIILSLPLILVSYKNKIFNFSLFTNKILIKRSIFLSLGYFVWASSLHLGPAVGVTAILMLKGIFIMLFGHYLFHEKLNPYQILGMIIISIGAILSI